MRSSAVNTLVSQFDARRGGSKWPLAWLLLLAACHPAQAPSPPSAGPSAVTAPASAAASDLRSSLTGTDEGGRFWIPTARAQGFDDADLLLTPDGRYVTHLHDRPSSAGPFSLDGDTLTLHQWSGDATLVMRELRLEGSVLRAKGVDGELEFERLRE